MRSDVVRFAFLLLVLVFGASLECVLPRLPGAGFPVLLSAVLVFAARRPIGVAAGFAVAAGFVEDSLSTLPFATSVACYLMMTAAVRAGVSRTVAAVFAYPLYQLWLWAWVPDSGGVFARVLLAFPAGFVTAVATASVVVDLERKAAADG